MLTQGIIRDLQVKTNDVDKYIFVKIELSQNTDIQDLSSMLLQSVDIKITPSSNI